MAITRWRWSHHVSRASGKEMVKVRYYGGLMDPPVVEYMPIMHEGYAGQKAMNRIAGMITRGSVEKMDVDGPRDCVAIAEFMNSVTPPSLIEYEKNGKFFNVKKYRYESANS
jgi:hypothetical protein